MWPADVWPAHDHVRGRKCFPGGHAGALGSTVGANSVNSLHTTRSAWRNGASDAGVQIFEIELVSSDAAMHRKRVERPIFPVFSSRCEREYLNVDTNHRIRWTSSSTPQSFRSSRTPKQSCDVCR